MHELPTDTPNTVAQSTTEKGEKFVLRLYVAGNTPQSTRAIERAKAFCESHLKDRYELTIVDLYQQPEATEDDQIIAAPTLVKKIPPPLRQLIGDLSNTSRLLLALDIDPDAE